MGSNVKKKKEMCPSYILPYKSNISDISVQNNMYRDAFFFPLVINLILLVNAATPQHQILQNMLTCGLGGIKYSYKHWYT